MAPAHSAAFFAFLALPLALSFAAVPGKQAVAAAFCWLSSMYHVTTPTLGQLPQNLAAEATRAHIEVRCEMAVTMET